MILSFIKNHKFELTQIYNISYNEEYRDYDILDYYISLDDKMDIITKFDYNTFKFMMLVIEKYLNDTKTIEYWYNLLVPIESFED